MVLEVETEITINKMKAAAEFAGLADQFKDAMLDKGIILTLQQAIDLLKEAEDEMAKKAVEHNKQMMKEATSIDWIKTGSGKSTYEIDEMMPKRKESFGFGNAMAAGGAAGAAAAGVFMLVNALQAATKQSKILTTVQDNIGKALGLLVDVILMPFIPIISMGLIVLFKAVMAFKGWWDDYLKSVKEKGLMGALGIGIDLQLLNPLGWGVLIGEQVVELLRIAFFGTEEEKSKSFTFKFAAILIGEVWEFVQDLLFGKKNAEGNRDGGLVDLSINLLKVISPISWILGMLEFLFTGKSETLADITKAIEFVVNFLPGNFEWLQNILSRLEALSGTRNIEYYGDVGDQYGPTLKKIDPTTNKPVTGGMTVNIVERKNKAEDAMAAANEVYRNIVSMGGY